MVDVQAAESFVKKRGDRVQQARLYSILRQKRPHRSVLSAIEDMRKSDGGFAFWDDDFSSIISTLSILGWIDDLSMNEGALVDKTFEFLLDHQQKDGGWDELEAVNNLKAPPFMAPGKTDTRVWLTACCAHWFVRFDRAEPPGAKGCPVRFLEKHVEPSGLLRGYLRATWDALVIFGHHPGVDSELFTNTVKAIECSFMPVAWDGSVIAWLLRALRDSGLKVDHPLVSRSLDVLETKQLFDGSWRSEDGDEYSVWATVDALRVLKDFGRV
ncbi:MAG: prenyltransferase/squalene oxidase repeat-containing protein [Candidatus Sifarchaeia archaeon]